MIIINADDLGMNERCSKAIAKAFEKGLVNSTTIMANGDFFSEAVELARRNGFSDKIGIHLNITEGVPLTAEINKMPDFVTDGHFNKQYAWQKELSLAEYDAIYEELSAQFERVEKAGIKITRADSHHYIHNAPFIAPIAERVCREHGVKKLRIMRNWGDMEQSEKQKADCYRDGLRSKGFVTTDYFGRLSEAEDKKLPKSIELLVHPDFNKDGNLVDRHGMIDGYAVGNSIISVDSGQ